MDLLERISEHEAGRHWWTALSRFEKLAFIRIRRDAEVEMRIKMGGEKDNALGDGQNILVDQRIS